MIFSESRINLGFNYGVVGGPTWRTTIVLDGADIEQRISQWTLPLHSYSFFRNEQRPLSDTELLDLQQFHEERQGSLEGFRYKDWADYKTGNELLGVGDGVRREFQLIKTYQWGGQELGRPITKPVAGSVRLQLDAVVQNTGWQVNPTNGLILFDTPPAPGVAVFGFCEFDVPVRFGRDNLGHRYLAQGGGRALFTLESLELKEVRATPGQWPAITAPPQDIPLQLPLGFDYGTVGGPAFDTKISPAGAGYEFRIARREGSRGAWEIGARLYKTELAHQILQAFWVCRGAASSFRYQDRQTNRLVRCRFKDDSLRLRFEQRDDRGEWLYCSGFGLVELL